MTGLARLSPFAVGMLFIGSGVARPEPKDIDTRTLRGKVLCGYQGWFRCPGDGTKSGWMHWSRDAQRITVRALTFEMWPDLSDFTADEKFAAPGFTHADGKQAYLFSSAHPKTVQRHFEWLRDHDIDGVFLQRFLVNLDDPGMERVLSHVRNSARNTGRVFAVEYDMTGMSSDKIVDALSRDWRRLVRDLKITQDPRYLHHNGKPVLAIFGFFSDRFDAALARQIIASVRKETHGVTLIGSGQWWWRTEKDAAWAKVLRTFDIICPWNVGNTTMVDGRVQARTDMWTQDLAEARKAGMGFMPVIYPGFGWDNLMKKKPGSTTIPRRGGQFLWEQFTTARRLDIDMAKIAMFDEVDEGTAIFKVSNQPPRPGRFLTYEDLPADWYLRLTGAGARLLRDKGVPGKEIPIKP
ncbi:MAG: hypothetical protein FJ271_22430 [Planctomycetes bacterium]|nr:hypothetical protein [Planctomycetota bacterium]